MRKFALVSAVIAFALLGVSFLIRAAFPGGADSFAGTSANESCDLLTAPELQGLSGKPLSGPTVRDVGGLPACQWGTPEGVGVQATSVPASTWAQQVPTLMEQLKASAPGTALHRTVSPQGRGDTRADRIRQGDRLGRGMRLVRGNT